jgi:regulator of protease activity HflC (stomatin/prohibitin superfamily)
MRGLSLTGDGIVIRRTGAAAVPLHDPFQGGATLLWLVLTIVLGIATIGGIVYVKHVPQGVSATGGYVVSGVAFFAWLVMTFFLSIHTVGQREVGIVYNFSGTIAGKKSPGVVMTAPWQHIKTENVAIQKDVFTFDSTNSAVSKDQQPITAQLVVNYQVEPQDVIGLYKTVGPSWKTVLLDGRVPQDFKETTAQFTSPQITLNRPLLRKITLRRLRKELGQYDIKVVDVFVNNVGYSEAYTNAIEAKQVQVQAALQAEAKVAQATAEANQAVATAEGEKRSAIARAEGDAKSIELKGKALRKNPEVIRYEALQKLAAQAQVIFCTTNNCPSILGSLAATDSGR